MSRALHAQRNFDDGFIDSHRFQSSQQLDGVSQPVKYEKAAHARTMVGAVMKDCKSVKWASWPQ